MVAVAQSKRRRFFLAAADVQVKADVQVRPSKDHNAFFAAGARWQAQDAANLMVSDFAKASHNLQFLDLRDTFCVAGAGRGQPTIHVVFS